MIVGVKLKKQYNGVFGKSILGSIGLGLFLKNVSRGLDSKLTRQIERSEESLEIVLRNRIGLAKPIHDRSQNSIGRAINWISRERNKGAIEMNGIELIATLNLIGEEADIELHENQTYLIPFIEAQKILNGLNQLSQSKRTVAM